MGIKLPRASLVVDETGAERSGKKNHRKASRYYMTKPMRGKSEG